MFNILNYLKFLNPHWLLLIGTKDSWLATNWTNKQLSLLLTFCLYHRLKQNWKQLHCLKCRFLFSTLSTFQKSLSELFSTFFVEIVEFPQIVLVVFHCFHIFCDPMKAAKFVLHTFHVFHLFCGFVTYTFNWFIISMLFVEL